MQLDQQAYHKDLVARFMQLSGQLRSYFEPTPFDAMDVDAVLAKIRQPIEDPDIQFLGDI